MQIPLHLHVQFGRSNDAKILKALINKLEKGEEKNTQKW